MKERPILFNTEMVKAILDGRKTQTRRIIKPQPYCDFGMVVIEDKKTGAIYNIKSLNASRFCCPYGHPGDRLWVRETFCTDWCDHVIYKADGGSAVEAGYKHEPRWKPSIHMPRSACRLLLDIVDVRVERLQDITFDDARKEGSYLASDVDDEGGFINLWDSINLKRGYGWDTNPWVWVIEFRRDK